MSTSKIIIIDSSHKITGTESNFTVDFNNSQLRNIKSVSLVGLRTINSQPNVSTGINDVISYIYNGVPKSITIPEGQYSVVDFIDEVNGLQTDFILDLNVKTKRFEWTSVGLPLTIIKDPVSDELIGLTQNLVDPIGAQTLTSQYVPDLSGLSIIHVSSEDLAAGNSILSNGEHSNILSSIPVEAAYGFPLVYTSQTFDQNDNVRYKIHQDLNQLRIRLIDHNYKPLNLKSTVHLFLKVTQAKHE